jgi:hypothetical protein
MSNKWQRRGQRAPSCLSYSLSHNSDNETTSADQNSTHPTQLFQRPCLHQMQYLHHPNTLDRHIHQHLVNDIGYSFHILFILLVLLFIIIPPSTSLSSSSTPMHDNKD